MSHQAVLPGEKERGFLCGVDLGQTHDYTAVSLIRRIERVRLLEPPELTVQRAHEESLKYGGYVPGGAFEAKTTKAKHYQVIGLYRFPLGTTYTVIVDQIRERMLRPELLGRTKLILDRTGVGRPVFDLFKAVDVSAIGVTFSAGNEPNRQDGGWTVPKADLVGALQATMGTNRLAVSGQIPEWPTLRQEMQNLEVRLSPSGRAQFAADWRNGEHDDLLFSLAIALWYGESVQELDPEAFSVSTKR